MINESEDINEVSGVSGVYFTALYDSKGKVDSVRIGSSKDIGRRIREHKSSAAGYKLYRFIHTSVEECNDEETRAQDYFKDYKIENSKYSKEMFDKINSYANERDIERSGLHEKQVKRTGKISTLEVSENGSMEQVDESLTKFRKRCSIFPYQHAEIMNRAGSGETYRTAMIGGVIHYLGSKAKLLYQAIRRDTKRYVIEILRKKGLLNCSVETAEEALGLKKQNKQNKLDVDNLNDNLNNLEHFMK